MKKGLKYYTTVLILVFMDTSIVSAQDNNLLPSFEPTNNSLTKFNSFGSINYTFERNQFSLLKDSNDTFESLKLSSLFDNKSKSIFLSQSENDINFAWQLSNFFSVSFNVFENQASYTDFENSDNNANQNQLFFNKSLSLINSDSINRNVSGYKLGLSSELGLGNDYRLDLNFDIGQLEGADLIGFNQKEINTTSFALGIRKSQFGASINTDIFLEDSEANLEQSRLGFELDWHFSKDGKLSFGSKKTIGDASSNQSNSIDDITGNVQYIKFQHNL